MMTGTGPVVTAVSYNGIARDCFLVKFIINTMVLNQLKKLEPVHVIT